MMNNEINQIIPQEQPSWEDDEIDLLEVARIVWKGRKLILSITMAGTLLSGIISFRMPNIYTATATIMPMDSSSDRLSSALSSLGALGGLASQAGGMKGSVSDKFVALLKSRTVTDTVVSKYHLMPVLFADKWDAKNSKWKCSSFLGFPLLSEAKAPTRYDAYRYMEKNLKAVSDAKTGLVSVNVESVDPQVAANIANYYVIELNAFLQNNSFSSAKRNRDFLQKQVNGVLRDLGKMESALKDFQEQNKLVSLDAQTEAAVQAYANLKAQLTAKEMELSLQANSLSSDDVQITGLKQEIDQLRKKIGGIESGASGGMVSFKDAPKLGMRFAQLKRDLLVKQNVFELMTQQLELAKVDEAKETLSFQVVDRAISPDKKSKPNRPLYIVLSCIASLVFAVMIGFVIEFSNQIKLMVFLKK